MRIQVISDIHLEFGPLELDVSSTDVLIAAGDIGLGRDGLYWLKDLDCHVVYVAGNHEFWGYDLIGLPQILKTMSHETHIHFLENQYVDIMGVRFIGCTLWTDFKNCDRDIMNEMLLMMNDFRYISFGPRSATPADLANLHTKSKQWLIDTLSKPYDGKVIVVTHHAPLMRSWYPDRDDPVRYAYCNDLSPIMQEFPIELWVHGHIHSASDYTSNGVRVVCNPRGYYEHKEVEEFEHLKLIET